MTHTMLSGHYQLGLVSALHRDRDLRILRSARLAGRTTSSRGSSRILWLIGGAFAMGQGIWAMHYIGMLAFRLPVAVSYNVPIVLLSLLAANRFSSAVALLVVSRKRLSRAYLTAGSFAMGGGIAAMHYIGMLAMRLAAKPIYNLRLVALSVITAILVSDVALRLAFRLRDQDTKAVVPPSVGRRYGFRHRKHALYRMAAVCFQHSAPPTGVSNSVSVSSLGITVIAAVTFMVLAFSLLGSQTRPPIPPAAGHASFRTGALARVDGSQSRRTI